MTRDEIDVMWQQALHQSVQDGEQFTRYRFAALVAANALELADKRIAELEKEAQFNFEQYQDAGRLLCEANEKLAVAREALIQLANAADNQGAFTGMSWQQAKAITTAALAQIAATEQK